MVTVLSTELHMGRHTGRGNAPGITHYFESESFSKYVVWCPLFLVYFWRPACFTFCSKSTSMQVARNSCCEALVG